MKKSLFLMSILAISLLSLFILPSSSKAVAFATDSVSIYENEKKINDDSVIFVASYKTHSEKCAGGVCSIGQQFYPVTIHKAKDNSTLLTFAEFSSQHPYQGDKYDGPAKDTWNAQNKEDYLTHLDENSGYSTSFNPGPSEGEEGCGAFCFGGRIGEDRSYTLDISNGNYNETSVIQVQDRNSSVRNIAFFSILILILALIFYFIIKKRKKV